MKSHFLASNTLVRIEFPKSKLIDIVISVSKTRLERERFVGAKDRNPKKRKTKKKKRIVAPEETIPMKNATKIINLSKTNEQKSPENKPPEEESPKQEKVPENDEISIHYVSTREVWDRNKTIIDNIFSFKVAPDITRSNDDKIEPQTVEECRCKND